MSTAEIGATFVRGSLRPSNLRSNNQSCPIKRSCVSVAAIGSSQSGIFATGARRGQAEPRSTNEGSARHVTVSLQDSQESRDLLLAREPVTVVAAGLAAITAQIPEPEMRGCEDDGAPVKGAR